MNQSLVLTKEFVIKASHEKVWEALTNPEIIKQYFFGTNTFTDWKVGSPVYFRGEWDGKAYEDKGTVLANEPGKLLRYNYWSSMGTKPDAPENYATITYRLEETAGTTKFTVIQDKIDSQEQLAHSDANWGMVMDGMKKLVENSK